MVLDMSCNARTSEPEVIDIDDVDRNETCIISEVPEYAEDIFKYLREAEVIFQIIKPKVCIILTRCFASLMVIFCRSESDGDIFVYNSTQNITIKGLREWQASMNAA